VIPIIACEHLQKPGKEVMIMQMGPEKENLERFDGLIGHWKDGVMDEEWLFWDNMSYMKQIGLGLLRYS